MLVHIEESLHEERFADLDLFAIVIFVVWTIVEGHPFDEQPWSERGSTIISHGRS
jgi:hypothetical protein